MINFHVSNKVFDDVTLSYVLKCFKKHNIRVEYLDLRVTDLIGFIGYPYKIDSSHKVERIVINTSSECSIVYNYNEYFVCFCYHLLNMGFLKTRLPDTIPAPTYFLGKHKNGKVQMYNRTINIDLMKICNNMI